VLSQIRIATVGDIPALQELIELSVRALSSGYYSPAQSEAALKHVFGIDTQLISDQTYYLIEESGRPVATGGWSARRTLFGGDQAKREIDSLLDPLTDAARIRAFFVHPDWTRRGLARRLYDRCETEARDRGFGTFELVATLPGEPVYRALGFVTVEEISVPLSDGLFLPCVRMARPLTRNA
jgi:GNAT superfamily N-acetyltransferase